MFSLTQKVDVNTTCRGVRKSLPRGRAKLLFGVQNCSQEMANKFKEILHLKGGTVHSATLVYGTVGQCGKVSTLFKLVATCKANMG